MVLIERERERERARFFLGFVVRVIWIFLLEVCVYKVVIE